MLNVPIQSIQSFSVTPEQIGAYCANGQWGYFWPKPPGRGFMTESLKTSEH